MNEVTCSRCSTVVTCLSSGESWKRKVPVHVLLCLSTFSSRHDSGTLTVESDQYSETHYFSLKVKIDGKEDKDSQEKRYSMDIDWSFHKEQDDKESTKYCLCHGCTSSVSDV